ncbi:MAG: sodium-dependent transporter [Prevotella sp.]|nr:sodium-dependent transporter [Prevotella sp.]
MEPGSFGSKIGVVLATAGSAVGLGNVWRFPYMTGENGGAAFIIVYIGCMLLLGIPGMISEFIVGRQAGSNAARAYGTLTKMGNWKLIGYLGILTSTLILGFYAVVAGWCLQYLFASMVGHLSGNADYVQSYFSDFSTNPWKPCFWAVAFILITHLVVVRGVRRGIERVSNLLMPALLVLLLILVVASCMLPGAYKGVEFLLKPDFSKLTGDVFLEALGQSFFSLSLGTACLCTYASYFSKQTNLTRSAIQIALLDSLIAILAGLMIFPAAFSVGVEPDQGPSLIFITLPNVFNEAFSSVPVVGYVVSIMFYALLVFAALTSTISMHEIGTAFFHEEMNMPRSKAAWILTLVCSVLAVLCSLSFGAYPQIQLFGMSLLDFFDRLTADIMLPLGSLFTCLLVGWLVPKQIVYDQLTNWGSLQSRLVGLYLVSVRFVCPLCIILIFLHRFGVI